MKKIILFLIGAFLILFFNLKAEENQVPNPFKEIVEWTYQQNVGLTLFYDLDKKDYLFGAKWQFLETKHQWINTGLFATEKPSTGIYIGFNLGKFIEKIKGQPMIYLNHLEVGYAITWDLSSTNDRRDGMYINVIKIEF
ncbi:MAG TPA: hypothetical protein PKV21_09460 [bacterium]|nr:hypothetical protein [bacterium]